MSAPRISGHITCVTRKNGDQWFASWRITEPGRPTVRAKRRIGPVWTGKGSPPEGYYDKRTATQWLQMKLTDLRRGIGVNERQAGKHTYGEACEEFVRWKFGDPRCAKSTVQGYRTTANRLAELFGESTPLAKVTTRRIEEIKEALQAEGRLSERSVQKLMVVNFGILKRAKKVGWIVSNPAEDAERVTPKRSGDFNVLSQEEVMAVSRAAASEQDRMLYIVAAFTGLRMGELRALRWSDIDFQRRSVMVRKNRVRAETKDPKSKRIRSVPMSDQVAVALDALSTRTHYTGPTDLVFPNDFGTYMDDAETRQRFYIALDRAGLGHKREQELPLRFHDLRHTFGTLGAQIWPLRDLQAYLGHASITTTEIYAHHVPKVAAADAFTSLIESGLPVEASSQEDRVSDQVSAGARLGVELPATSSN